MKLFLLEGLPDRGTISEHRSGRWFTETLLRCTVALSQEWDPILNMQNQKSKQGNRPLFNRPRRSMPRPPRAAPPRRAQRDAPLARVNRKPGMRTESKLRPFLVKRREYIQEVNGTNSSTPTITTLQLNPGLASAFPLGYVTARLYDQYRVKNFKICFEAATSATIPGLVYLSPEYNVNEPPPTTKSQLVNTMGAEKSQAWVDGEIHLDVSSIHASGPRKFVRSGLVPDNRIAYDIANLSLLTVNNGTTDAIGELWFEYELEFYVPQKETTTTSMKVSAWNLSSAQTLASTVAETIVYDEATSGTTNQLGITNTSGVFTLPIGVYRVDYQLSCFDTAAETFSATVNLQKNGAAMVPPVSDGFTSAAVANQRMPISGFAVLTSDGTDTFEINVTLTGAAGTLTVEGDYTRILFSVI